MNSLDETHCHHVPWKEFSEAFSWTTLLVLPSLVPFVSPLKESAQHTALACLLVTFGSLCARKRVVGT